MNNPHTSGAELTNLAAAVELELQRRREDMVDFVCECNDTRCRRVVRLTIEQYDAVRERREFVVAPGHLVLPARDAA